MVLASEVGCTILLRTELGTIHGARSDFPVNFECVPTGTGSLNFSTDKAQG